MEALEQFKVMQKQAWALFIPIEMASSTAAPNLVRFAGIGKGAEVLDVACGTGVVALTAARLGARVTGIDLTPELIAHAKENTALMKADARWHEGDVEALPFEDGAFDFVVSQCGHMFAPRPDVAIAEMLRVLKPGGTIAFSTWPPELYVGQLFALIAKYSPPPPAGVSPPTQWGDPSIVRERLGARVKDLCFDRGTLRSQTLSVQHHRYFIERNVGPVARLMQMLEPEPVKLISFRRDLERLTALYFEDNHVRQDFLMTRAIKV